MALPVKKNTKRSKRTRASHFALKKQTLNKCASCNSAKKPHHACPKCGSYKGKKTK